MSVCINLLHDVFNEEKKRKTIINNKISSNVYDNMLKSTKDHNF